MVDLVIGGFVVLAFGGYIYNVKRIHDKKFVSAIEVWENNLTTFMDNNGIKDIDFNFSESVSIKIVGVKKKSNRENQIRAIGLEINKGYDFIDCSFNEEYSIGPHTHSGSSEFFYVIDGSAKLIVDNMEKILKPGDYAYLKEHVIHEFYTEKDFRCLVVTLPNIIKASDQ